MSDQRLISQLEDRFPWLKVTDEEDQISGADVVQSLIDWHFTLQKESSDADYPPIGDREYPTFQALINAAVLQYEEEGSVEVERDAVISFSDNGGAYVMGWLFVDGDLFCRTCKDPYTASGDGFDGECPSCADKTAKKEENAGTNTDGQD